MHKQLIVTPAIFQRFPGMRIVAVAVHDVDNRAARPAIESVWQEAWDEAAPLVAAHGNAQSHPHVRAWREAMRSVGVSPKEFPSSIEALLRRAGKGGPPFRINPLVDFYNAISLRHVVPVGAFDLGEIEGPIELRLTRDVDTFLAMDSNTAVTIAPNEVAYVDGSTVLTRHFVWRQSRAGLISPETRSALLVSEILSEVGPEVAEQVLQDLQGGLEAYFKVTAVSSILDETSLSFSW
jgi:DNA/RNA-binding domain of Phe-tRNA-synthetase-like protein